MKKLHEYEHPYYCSTSNYYSNEPSQRYDTFSDFYEDWHDADIDMNLIFRFDVKKREESEKCYAEIFIMQQRKGIFKPVYISYFDEQDEKLAIPLLKKHWQHLKKMWEPISNTAQEYVNVECQECGGSGGGPTAHGDCWECGGSGKVEK